MSEDFGYAMDKPFPNPPKRKKVALVGTASSSFSMTPWNDYTFDIFALAWRQGDIVRSDALFDIHKIDQHRKRVPENYLNWLASRRCPVYVQEVLSEVPNSVKYPLDEVVAKFGKYFASSVSFMIALAILKGYEEIHLFGIDLLDDSEYSYQRPNTEYLLGYAAGLGIKICIPHTSALLKYDHIYGYEVEPDHCGITPEVLQTTISDYRDMHEEGKKQAYTADGARQAIETLLARIKQTKRGKV